MSNNQNIILGIDPGTLIMGYGLILVDRQKISMLEMGVLRLAQYKNHPERLAYIYKKIEALIKIHNPSAIAIEAPFYGKNIQSMLKLGRAQGVAIAAGMAYGLEAIEYAPRKIKQSVTGRGAATKEQVWGMLQTILKFKEKPEFMDATDALAVALCHHYQQKNIVNSFSNSATVIDKIKNSKKKTDWSTFVAQNKNRIS